MAVCCQAPSLSPLGASGLKEKVQPCEPSTCARTRRRPRYRSGGSHQAAWAPGGFRFSSLVVPSDPEPQAAGRRPQGPCCLAQHSSASASVDRGSGEKHPGLRVRGQITSRVQGQSAGSGSRQKPALRVWKSALSSLVNRTWAFPAGFLFRDISTILRK